MRCLFRTTPGPSYETVYTEAADQEGLSADNALKAHATCGFDRNVATVDGRDTALKARRARIFEDFKTQGLYEAYFGIRKPRRKNKVSAAGKPKEEAPRRLKVDDKKQARARPQTSVGVQSAAGKPAGSSTKRRSGIAAIKALLVNFPYVPPPPTPEQAKATTKKEKKTGAAAVRGAIGAANKAADEATMGTSQRKGNASAAAKGKAKGKGKK